MITSAAASKPSTTSFDLLLSSVDRQRSSPSPNCCFQDPSSQSPLPGLRRHGLDDPGQERQVRRWGDRDHALRQRPGLPSSLRLHQAFPSILISNSLAHFLRCREPAACGPHQRRRTPALRRLLGTTQHHTPHRRTPQRRRRPRQDTQHLIPQLPPRTRLILRRGRRRIRQRTPRSSTLLQQVSTLLRPTHHQVNKLSPRSIATFSDFIFPLWAWYGLESEAFFVIILPTCAGPYSTYPPPPPPYWWKSISQRVVVNSESYLFL